MAEGAILDPPADAPAPDAVSEEGSQEVPSVFSVVTRYLVGGVEVSPPQEDGSRVVRLHSASGQAVVEGNLSPQLCEFLSGKLVEVEVITQEDEDAGAKE